jgi:hypothetical protein
VSKKLILIIIGVLVLVGGGFALYYFVLRPNSSNVFVANTKIKAADDFIIDLTSGNKDAAYAKLSDDRKANYPESYWKDEFFPQFANYKEQPKRIKAQELKSDDTTPAAYAPWLEPWEFSYEFTLHKLTYRLDFVLLKQDNQFKVDAIKGAYQGSQ